MGFSFVLQDLKEYWAFWLEKKQFKGEHFKGLDSAALEKRVEEEFDLFKNNNTTSSPPATSPPTNVTTVPPGDGGSSNIFDTTRR